MMKLIKIEKTTEKSKVKLTGLIERKDKSKIKIYFEYPRNFSKYINKNADAFVPMLVIGSMENKEDLEIKPPVSKLLLSNIERMQKIFIKVHPEIFSKINISARKIEEYKRHKKAAGIGLFFTLGVDSFYTLYKDLEGENKKTPKITHLIYINLVPPNEENDHGSTDKKIFDNIRKIAKETGKSCIFGKTNVRVYFPKYWEQYYVGIFSSIALSLSNGLSYGIISLSKQDVMGGDGDTDLAAPLWSTEKTRIEQYDARIFKEDKIASFLVEKPLAMKYLRVCEGNASFKNKEAKNCGSCWKCIKTMLPLYITGNLKKAESFPHKIDKEDLKKALENERNFFHFKESLRLAKKYKEHRHLVLTIRYIMLISRIKNKLYKISFRLKQRSKSYKKSIALIKDITKNAEEYLDVYNRN